MKAAVPCVLGLIACNAWPDVQEVGDSTQPAVAMGGADYDWDRPMGGPRLEVAVVDENGKVSTGGGGGGGGGVTLSGLKFEPTRGVWRGEGGTGLGS
jgi:hypothetical protein